MVRLRHLFPAALLINLSVACAIVLSLAAPAPAQSLYGRSGESKAERKYKKQAEKADSKFRKEQRKEDLRELKEDRKEDKKELKARAKALKERRKCERCP